MDKIDLLNLLRKYRDSQCSDDELELLHYWLKYGNFESYTLSEDEIRAKLKDLDLLIVAKSDKKSLNFNFRRNVFWKVACLVLFLFGIYSISTSDLFFNGDKESSSNYLAGTNKAYLKLHNGDVIYLDDQIDSNQTINVDEVEVRINSLGQIIYSAQVGSEHKVNEIKTPKGGQYELILSDGTHVWLNADTKLSFNNNFNGLKFREVTLDGEAYFKVATNKRQPFVVLTNNQKITVTGTEFNVSSYSDNNYIKTSLIEGSVLFNDIAIYPGQSVVYQGDNSFVKQDNMDDVVAWKNGYFTFFNENLESAMKKICRWYDLDVEYLDLSVKRIKLGGSISKYENAEKIFDMIEKAADVTIKTNGKRILINKI